MLWEFWEGDTKSCHLSYLWGVSLGILELGKIFLLTLPFWSYVSMGSI